MSDLVNHPPHYANGWSNGAEVIDITEHLNFNRGSAVKYIARAGKKDPTAELQDLKKAQWYIGREISRISAQLVDTTFDNGRREARRWQSVYDAPPDTVMRDKDGDLWKVGTDGKILFRGREASTVGMVGDELYAPYVEEIT